jgi:hypothetical protein
VKTRQVKIYAEPELAEAFKALCKKSGTSVTTESTAYMRKRTQLKGPATMTGNRVDKRWQRKATVRGIIRLLENVRAAEEAYRDNILKNLSGGPLAEAADETVTRLTEAVDTLSDAYAVKKHRG